MANGCNIPLEVEGISPIALDVDSPDAMALDVGMAINQGGGGGGAVNSVNGKTGDVVLDASDVGALPATAVPQLLDCFRNMAWINNNGETYLNNLATALGYTVYSITNTLSNCETNNNSSATISGSPYSATITADTGYVMTGATVSITMGGTDITATAYSNGVISIPAVTGALVITISAAEAELASISAVYTQSGTVYDTDSLDSLKSDLVVTAIYSDSSTAVIPAASYTLSGTLTEGAQTITVSFGGYTDTFSVTVTAILPVEYQRVEYLQSTGSEYIDLGFTGDATTQVKIVMQRLTAVATLARMFGSRGKSWNTGNAVFLGTLNSGVYTNFRAVASDGSEVPWDITGKHTIEFSLSKWLYDGTEHAYAEGTAGTGSFTTPSNLYLFNAKSNGSFGTGMSAKLYEVVVSKSNTEAFHGYPCYRKADSVPGVFDIVSNTFKTNASGSGAFVVGGDA